MPIYNALIASVPIKMITEIRIRKDKPIFYAIGGAYRSLADADGVLIATAQDVEHVVAVATKNSLYGCNHMLVDGFLACDGGIRIGVAGEGVLKNGRLSTIRNITSLCIRLPHEVECDFPALTSILARFDHTLIISRPGLGKTTALRWMIRKLANSGYNVLALDERYELSGGTQGTFAFDLGRCCDVALGISKSECYRTLLRTMRPDVLATDEIFDAQEVDALCDAARCGVKVLATLHCDNYERLRQDRLYGKLCDWMRYVVVLKGVGMLGGVYERGD